MFNYSDEQHQKFYEDYKDYAKKNPLGEKYINSSDKIIYAKSFRIFYYPPSGYKHNRVFVVIPSLFNSAEILFLNSAKSFIQRLQQQGEIYLIEWQAVKVRDYSLNDYVQTALKAIEFLKKIYINQSVDLIGHCIGGNIALACTILKEEYFRSLTLLTTPWDFSHFDLTLKAYKLLCLDEQIKKLDMVPKIHIQILFFLLFPDHFNSKLEKYASLQSPEAKDLFFRVEHWLMSGKCLPKATYFQIMEEIIEKNKLAKLEWKINDKIINPSLCKKPVCQVVAQNDRMVPRGSILPLHDYLKKSTILPVEGGHISYLTGHKINSFFQSYQGWLKGT